MTDPNGRPDHGAPRIMRAVRLIALLCIAAGGQEMDTQQARATFLAVDSDSDGVLMAYEVQNFYSAQGASVSDAEVGPCTPAAAPHRTQ